MLYYVLVEQAAAGRRGLNNLMNEYRLRWMLEMQRRDNRIVDASLLGHDPDQHLVLRLDVADRDRRHAGAAARHGRRAEGLRGPAARQCRSSRGAFEAKVLGLTIIFGYAFFKFAWAARLFSYEAILIGRDARVRASARVEQRRLTAVRAAEMNIVAGRHFNRGLRAFFFAVAYLGWFVSPYVLIGSTALTLGVMWQRQFASDARAAVIAARVAARSSRDD